MELKEVIITNRDSCKTYPLRRIGLENLIDWKTDTPTIHDLISSCDFIKLEEPIVGCILIWVDNDYLDKTYLPHHIDKDGYVYNIIRYNYGHCAIYEGNDKISECCVEHRISVLKLRKYSDIRKPDFILKLKE